MSNDQWLKNDIKHQKQTKQNVGKGQPWSKEQAYTNSYIFKEIGQWE